ncbi:MAG TPA: helix-turn-helix transcriptional regulator [Burkholderiales bacterium]|nr:helix-turn-helix transcriptional regulator [Burkholderiales bacterium]
MAPHRPSGSSLERNAATEYQKVPRPVVAKTRELAADHEIDWHTHPRFQVIYASEGVMMVDTQDETWVVPPLRAIWMPPGMPHRVRASGRVRMRSLYVRPDAAARMPQDCHVLPVTPLLRELIRRATEMPLEYDEHGAEGRVMGLILDELASLARLPYNLPMPKQGPLARVCARLVEHPAEATTREAVAARLGMTGRTLDRHFKRQLGMNFGEWCRRAALLRALAWFAEGRPVTAVALDLGYASLSAFCAMFKRETGRTPRAHLRELKQAG